MCTLLLAWQVFDAPVVAAATRDEAHDRPAAPPERRGPVVAPRDERAGGTWIGANDHGVFAALTNRWAGVDGDRSRGLLVDDALGAASAEDAGRTVERSVEEASHGGFNLVVADDEAALAYEYDGTLSVSTLAPGVHVVVNVGVDGGFVVPENRREAAQRQADGARRALAALRPEPGETAAAWRSRARAVLADHDYGFCVHGDGFGTRSASLLTVGEGVDYRYADGPPCEAPFHPVNI
jgi:uncharacterized protein with NRDE domain